VTELGVIGKVSYIQYEIVYIYLGNGDCLGAPIYILMR